MNLKYTSKSESSVGVWIFFRIYITRLPINHFLYFMLCNIFIIVYRRATRLLVLYTIEISLYYCYYQITEILRVRV